MRVRVGFRRLIRMIHSKIQNGSLYRHGRTTQLHPKDGAGGMLMLLQRWLHTMADVGRRPWSTATIFRVAELFVLQNIWISKIMRTSF
jgi:hypothetical protein